MQEFHQRQLQLSMGLPGYMEREKGKQVEVQRAAMDEVFKTLESGVELDQSDPGEFLPFWPRD